MCDYCEKEKTIFQTEVIGSTVYVVSEIKTKHLPDFEYPLGLFIDTRGYLRLVDLGDCNCLDAGEKIKISFCPFCGSKILKEEV